MYVDESGDPGKFDETAPTTGSQHYIVTGIIVKSDQWRPYLNELVQFKRYAKKTYGLDVRAELHGAELIRVRSNSPKSYRSINKAQRIQLYADALNYLVSNLSEIQVINVHLDKLNPKGGSKPFSGDVQEVVWQRLIERYDRFLKSVDDQGLIFADQTNEAKIRRLLRKMRLHHYVPSAYGTKGLSANAARILEDPNMRSSEQSFFVQIADLISHSLYRKLYPKGSLKRLNVDKLFDLTDGVLLKKASSYDPQGIVKV